MKIHIKGGGGVEDYKDGRGGVGSKSQGGGRGGEGESGVFEGVEHEKKRGFVLVCLG